MKIGYIRMLSTNQNMPEQLKALEAEGCEKIIQENVCKVKVTKDQLNELLGQLKEGDIIVVCGLDQICGSLKNIIDFVTNLENNKIELISLSDSINTTIPGGRTIFKVFNSLSKFKKDSARSRTKIGIEFARQQGRKLGRPEGLSEAAKKKALDAENLYLEGSYTVERIAKNIGISKSTMYRYLRSRGVKIRLS